MYDVPPEDCVYLVDALRLEYVITCVGFDDFLDESLRRNVSHFDLVIVVTSHADHKTQYVATKHGALVVQTDLFRKNGRRFNKGAAINAGMDRFQYHGWRMHMDADIVLPESFRRLLFNHTCLDRECIYGADHVDVVGKTELHAICCHEHAQHVHSVFVHPVHHRPLSPRYVDQLRGYIPLGYFQLWHARAQKPYPYSLGTAAHDDVMFAAQWSECHRRLLPSVMSYHLCARPPSLGENWDGQRRQPRWS